MVRKGNLLYNGDFETGTTEEWILGPFGLMTQHNLTVSPEACLRGYYGGMLEAVVNGAETYLAYDKMCSFEEYEAYLFVFPFNLVNGLYNLGQLYGLDDKGNLLEKFWLGYNDTLGEWRKIVALLRGFSDITHFKVGAYVLSQNSGDKFYFDEVKLYPLKSIKSIELAEVRNFYDVQTNTDWYSGLACIGQCRLRSIIKVQNISGTSATLDIDIYTGLFTLDGPAYYIKHSQFSADGFEEIKIDLPEVSWIYIKYTVGGDNPRFNIYHNLRVEPDKTVLEAEGGAL